ncbi:MAG TPA: hypothetical protein VIG40_01400 [Tissierellaceae bacterium]
MAKKHNCPWTDDEVELLMDYVSHKDMFETVSEMCEDVAEKLERTPNAVYRKIYETESLKDEYDKHDSKRLQKSKEIDNILLEHFHLIPQMTSSEWFDLMEELTGSSRGSLIHRVHAEKLKGEYDKYDFIDERTNMVSYHDDIVELLIEGEYEWLSDLLRSVAEELGFDEKQVRNYIYNNGYNLDTVNELRMENGAKPLRTPRDGFSIDDMLEIEDILMSRTFKTKSEAYHMVADMFNITYPIAERRMQNAGLNEMIIKDR